MNSTRKSVGGIGVSTTHARLKHLFGADYRFEFHRQHAGLAVVVAVPWRTEAADHASDHDTARTSDRDLRSSAQALGPLDRIARQHP